MPDAARIVCDIERYLQSRSQDSEPVVKAALLELRGSTQRLEQQAKIMVDAAVEEIMGRSGEFVKDGIAAHLVVSVLQEIGKQA